MPNRRRERTLPERLYHASVLSDGALPPIAYGELINEKIEEDSDDTDGIKNKVD